MTAHQTAENSIPAFVYELATIGNAAKILVSAGEAESASRRHFPWPRVRRWKIIVRAQGEWQMR